MFFSYEPTSTRAKMEKPIECPRAWRDWIVDRMDIEADELRMAEESEEDDE